MPGIDRLLRPLRRGLAHLVSRAVVTLVNDAAKMQALQVKLLAEETLDGIEHWQPYGFTAHPLPGAEALVLAVGGHRAHSVVVSCGDRRFRLTALEPGEVAIYTDEGDKLHFKRGNAIEVETRVFTVKASEAAHFQTPLITTTGRIESAGDQVAAGISQVGHAHGDVEPGNGISGGPQ